jgi:hypothetical protein
MPRSNCRSLLIIASMAGLAFCYVMHIYDLDNYWSQEVARLKGVGTREEWYY